MADTPTKESKQKTVPALKAPERFVPLLEKLEPLLGKGTVTAQTPSSMRVMFHLEGMSVRLRLRASKGRKAKGDKEEKSRASKTVVTTKKGARIVATPKKDAPAPEVAQETEEEDDSEE